MSDQTPHDVPQDQAQAEALLKQLAATTALIPQEPQDREATPEGAIALPVVEQDGTQYVPVFTSPEAMVSAGADPTTAIQVPLAELAAGWPSDDLWLAVDPSSQEGLTLPPDVVRVLPALAGS